MRSFKVFAIVSMLALFFAAFASAIPIFPGGGGSSGGGGSAPTAIPTSTPGLAPVPGGYIGPTIRASSDSSTAPAIIQPSSGAGTATLTFNAGSQGNCQANDEMFFFLANDTSAISNASGTHLDSTSFTNGRSETWHQTWAASTSVVFTDVGNHIWWGIGICVVPGSRGHPVLVDQHVLAAASQSSNYQYSVNSSPITPTQSPALHLIFATQTCNASCAANNQIFLNSPMVDDIGVTNGEGWTMFSILQNPMIVGPLNIAGSYRLNTDRDPNFNWTYIGSASGGSGNDQFAVIDVY